MLSFRCDACLAGTFDAGANLCERHQASSEFGVEFQDPGLALEQAARSAVASLGSQASAKTGKRSVLLLSSGLGLAKHSPVTCLDLAISILRNETLLRSGSTHRVVAAEFAARDAYSNFWQSGGDPEQLLPRLQEMNMLSGVAIHQRGDFEHAAAYHQESLDRLAGRTNDQELKAIADIQRVKLASSLYCDGEREESRRRAFKLIDEIDPSQPSAGRLLAVAKAAEHHLRERDATSALEVTEALLANQEADWPFTETGGLELSVNQIILARDIAEARILDGDESGLSLAYDAQCRAEVLGLSDQFSKLKSMVEDAERRPRLSQHGKSRVMNVERVDALILTVRSDELEALRLHLGGTSMGFVHKYMWEVFSIDTAGGQQVVAIVATGSPGNTRSQEIASMAIETFQPERIILCGIGGAVPSDEICLGDVIFPHSILDYSVSAALPGGKTQYALSASEGLDALATIGGASISSWGSTLDGWSGCAEGEAIEIPKPPMGAIELTVDPLSEWGQKVIATMSRHSDSGRLKGLPKAVTGVLATSNQLIKDPNIVISWHVTARQILAVEMEAGGVLASARRSDRPCLVVRGISDVIGLVRDPAWTEYACHSAARFTAALLRSGKFT